MLDTLQTLTSIQPPRNYKNIKSLNTIADYIKQRFEEIGLETSFQTFKILGFEYKNVIGVLNPDKEQTLIVGGHYDVCGNQPGADDNASAVAGVIETAKRLKEDIKNIRIEFVAFTLEEPPFFNTFKMGSYVHAKSVKDKNIIGMINYEMIGYYSDEENSQKYPFLLKMIKKDVEFPTVGNFLGIVSNNNSMDFLKKFSFKANELKLFELNLPKFVDKQALSDQLNYWKLNIPAIMVTDTAYFRNPNYHKKTDTLDTLDLKRMSLAIDIVCDGIRNLDNNI